LVIKGRATDYKKSRLIADAEIKLNAEILEVWMPDYWRYVEYGVSPNAIPYDPHKRSGKKHSKYINALLHYLSTKGKSSTDPRTKNIAFAIAAKQRKVGNPINKAKLNWISATIQKWGSKWASDLEKILNKKFETLIYREIDASEKQKLK